MILIEYYKKNELSVIICMLSRCLQKLSFYVFSKWDNDS
jgi:hypothetical protein